MIDVGVFTPEEAHAYLQSALADQPHLLDGATDLAAAVGHLPLALAQASAYMLDRGLSCSDYQRRFHQRRLASLVPEPGALPDEHQETVAATCSLSVEQANLLEPLSARRITFGNAPRENSHYRTARVDTAQRSDEHHAHPLQAGGPHARHTHYGQPSGG
jgi:hypothetical protein